MCHTIDPIENAKYLAKKTEEFNARILPEVKPFNGDDGISWQSNDLMDNGDMRFVMFSLDTEKSEWYFDSVTFKITYFDPLVLCESKIYFVPDWTYITLTIDNYEYNEILSYKINLGTDDIADHKETVQKVYDALNTCFLTIKNKIDITDIPRTKDFIRDNLTDVVMETFLKPIVSLGINAIAI